MKNLMFLISLVSVLFLSCEEVPPFIDFSKPVVLLLDTAYINPVVPAAQHKMVLIEDITGVRCINCPDAAKKAEDIINQKSPDSVIVIAQYPTTILPNFTTPYPNVPQLANETSYQIVDALGPPQGLPSGYVDRKPSAGKTDRNISYPEWITNVNARLREKTNVNISMSKQLNGRKLTVEIKLEYIANVTSGHLQKYFLYLIEDKIVSTQYTHSYANGDPNYVHNHALRYAFGLSVGNPLSGPYVAGKTYLKQLEYEIPSNSLIANCHLVCAVLDATTEEVINVREIDLK